MTASEQPERPEADPDPDPDPDPAPEAEPTLQDAAVRTKPRQRQGRRTRVKLRVAAPEALDLTAAARGAVLLRSGGAATVAAKRFRLKRVRKAIDGGHAAVLELKLRRKRDNRRVFRLLRRGRVLVAKVTVVLVDDAGDTVRRTERIRLALRKKFR